MCSHPSWEEGDRHISFHTVCDTEPEMGHGGVQISLSLRDDLRLPDQFWQVTGSFQGKHICDKGQAGFHVSARILQSQVGLRLLTIRVCGYTWFLFEIKKNVSHAYFFYRCNAMFLLISPWLYSRSCQFECQYIRHYATRRAMHFFTCSHVILDPKWWKVNGITCYVCIGVCTHISTCICMDVYVEARGKPWYHSPDTVHLVFRDRVSHSFWSHWDLDLLIRLGCLISEFQGPLPSQLTC